MVFQIHILYNLFLREARQLFSVDLIEKLVNHIVDGSRLGENQVGFSQWPKILVGFSRSLYKRSLIQSSLFLFLPTGIHPGIVYQNPFSF